jgi:outer membrane protein
MKIGQISDQAGVIQRMSAKLSSLQRGLVDLTLLLVPAERKDDADVEGGHVVTRRKRSTTIVKAFVSRSLIFALSAGAVHAADLPTAPPSPVTEAAPRWYVKLGALGGLDQSWSSLFAQQVAGVVVPGIGLVPVSGFGPQVSLVGRGATYSSVFTASFQAGYFFTPNWSLEVAGAVPLWLTIKITGFSATPPFSGTVLGKLLPGAVPITAVYHFTQLGAIQPYLGGGIVPSFEFAVQDGFNTGGYFKPTAGLVAQAGADYMFNRNWGVFLDVKKLFIWSTGTSTGFDFGAPIGTIPGAATIKTTFEPWLFSTGVTYRF